MHLTDFPLTLEIVFYLNFTEILQGSSRHYLEKVVLYIAFYYNPSQIHR